MIWIGVAIGLFALVWLFRWFIEPWIMAAASKAPVSPASIVGMRFRGSDPKVIVLASIALLRLGESVPSEQIEAVYLSLPPAERTWGTVLERVRPQLVADALARQAGPKSGGGAD